jgi:hypothetical protein
LGVEGVYTELFTEIFSVTVVKYVLKALAISKQSLHIFPSISIDEILWLRFVLLVTDLIICHEVFSLLFEFISKLL